jgi:cytochrome c oxidase subunit 4
MVDPHHPPAHTPGPGDTTDDAFAAAKKGYTLIFVLLVALVLCAAGVSLMNFGGGRVYANLIIAGVQAALLAYFFMHLKESDQLTWLVAGAGLFWVGILFLLLLTDYVTRYIAAY